MKLNPKCVRDLLEVFEEAIQDANATCQFSSMEALQEEPPLAEYATNELAYHIQQLYLSGFLYNGELYPDGGFSFMDITPKAHALLANLRIPKVFKMLQILIGVAGSASINQMAFISTTAMASTLPEIMNFAQEALRKIP